MGTTVAARASSAQWRAVLARDRRYDDAFVYAVRSTGVFCRPSCPSRRPRRSVVTFFPGAAAARQAGFRPCRRCRPEEPDRDRALVARACEMLDEWPDGTPSARELALRLGTTPERVTRAFRRALGLTWRRYWDERRLVRLKAQLRAHRRVTPALYAAGYGGSSRVYEQSNARLGMTPAAYARGGAHVRIGYAVVPSPLGAVLVAATERGVCRVALGDDAERGVRDLRAEFPTADVRPDRELGRRATAALARYLDGATPALDLPLDVRATAFQRRVWDALRAIPRGETRSYGAVARAVGRPRAARAVARACATNPTALAVPCHRVVPADGAVGGYRWGTARKRRLLALEREAPGAASLSAGTPGGRSPGSPARGGAARARAERRDRPPAGRAASG